jgi:hypothetical protein
LMMKNEIHIVIFTYIVQFLFSSVLTILFSMFIWVFPFS